MKALCTFLLFAATLGAQGQQPPLDCLPCMLGRNPDEPSLQHFVYDELQALYGMGKDGYYLSRSNDVVQWVSMRYDLEEFASYLPALLAYLPIKPDMKETLRAFRELPRFEITDKKKRAFTVLDRSANVIWDLEINEAGDYKDVTASRYLKDRPVQLPWCNTCPFECPENQFAKQIAQRGPLMLWTLTDSMDYCDRSTWVDETPFLGPIAVGNHQRYISPNGDYWFELDRSKRIERTGIDVAKYRGDLPLGLTAGTSLSELQQRFGINYKLEPGRYHLLLGKFDGQHKDPRVLLTLIMSSDESRIDSIFIQRHPGYPLDGPITATTLPEPDAEVGCLMCQSSEGCTGYDCTYRFSDGYELLGKLYEGRPVAGRVSNGFREIGNFYDPELAAWLKEQGIELGPPEEEVVVFKEEPKVEPVPRTCSQILWDIMYDDFPYLIDLASEFMDALNVVLRQKLDYGTYEQSAYDKMRLVGSSMTSTMGHMEMELYTAGLDCPCPELNAFQKRLQGDYMIVSGGFKSLILDGYTVAVKSLSGNEFPFEFYAGILNRLPGAYVAAKESCE